MQTTSSRRSATVHVRQIMISAVLVVLVCLPGFALAQGATGHWLLHNNRPTSPDRGSTMQMQGMIEQMSGMIEHMAARLQAGPMTPEQAKQMGELMGSVADMTSHLSWMMAGGVTAPDMPQQMTTMMERMTEMRKRMMGMIAVPKQDKK